MLQGKRESAFRHRQRYFFGAPGAGCSSQRADPTACGPAVARRARSAASTQASLEACSDTMLTCETRNTMVKTYTDITLLIASERPRRNFGCSNAGT